MQEIVPGLFLGPYSAALKQQVTNQVLHVTCAFTYDDLMFNRRKD
jgi:hypothetical protein